MLLGFLGFGLVGRLLYMALTEQQGHSFGLRHLGVRDSTKKQGFEFWVSGLREATRDHLVTP